MGARIRLFAAFIALVTAVILVVQSAPLTVTARPVDLRSTAAPWPQAPEATTTIKWPVVETTDPDPFDPCRDIPLDVVQSIGLAFTPPEPEDSHRGAQYWVMKPTDWNNRWWITCALVFKTSYGLIQQSLFYSPTYSASDVDCMQTNLPRAHELAPHFIY